MLVTESQRLRLRHFTKDDLRALTALMADKQVMQHALSGPLSPVQVEQFLQGILATYEKKGFSLWAVEHKQDNQVIGFCGHFFQRIHGHDEIELVYRLLPQYWGQGLASEAGAAARDYAFSQLALPRLIAFIAKHNQASIRVAEKLGFAFWQQTKIAGRDVLIYRCISPRHGVK